VDNRRRTGQFEIAGYSGPEAVIKDQIARHRYTFGKFRGVAEVVLGSADILVAAAVMKRPTGSRGGIVEKFATPIAKTRKWRHALGDVPGDKRVSTGQDHGRDDGKILQVVCISGDPVPQGIVDGHTIVCRIDSEPRMVDT
jgi:hypothetical protein